MIEQSDEGVLVLEVVEMRRESDGVVSVALADVEGGILPAWAPGAHVDLYLPAGPRQYSLCGDPADRLRYRVAVLREPASRGGSRFVHDTLRIGDELEVGGPRNHFALQDAGEYLFIAGGIGITPLLPMVRAVAAAGREWQLVYGSRERAAMAFRDELAAHGDRVRLLTDDAAGPIDAAALLATPRPGTAIYCCGPEGLLGAVEGSCASWPEGALHTERFKPRPVTRDRPDKPFAARCARSGIELQVPGDRSLLDVLEASGLEVLNACREGMCGACETAVLGGDIDHRDSVLTAGVRAGGRTMLVCVSRARDESIVLDI